MTMKTMISLALCMSAWLGMSTCNSAPNETSTEGKGCPIKAETSKIVYYEYSNSGLAIHTKYEIYRDSIVWDYEEVRNDCHLRDVITYPDKDFDELIGQLSKIKFSAKDSHDTSSGGSGYYYAFSTSDKDYFHFNSSYKLSGDIGSACELIQSFIKSHTTDGLAAFQRLSAAPHERAVLGEFEELPEELEKYRVK